MSKRVFSLVLAVVMLATVVVPAFAQTPAPVAPAAGTAVTTTAPAAPAVPITKTDTAGKTLRIVYIPKNTGNPYFDSIINGFKKAAAELGFEFTTVAPSTAEGTAQIPFIKEQVQRGVDAIAISPDDPDAVVPALQQAMAKNIRVVCVNSDMNVQGREVAVLPMDFSITGSSQVELLGSLINYEGEIAILSATTTAPDQNTWIEGMKVALQDPKYAKMKLVKIAYGDDDPQKSSTEAQALLTAFPNLRGIIAPTTVAVAAAAQVIETAKVADKVQLVGLGTPNQMRRFIKNGTVTKFALWSPFSEGYLSGYMMYGMLTGQVKPAEKATFNVPTLGDRVFLKDNQVITGPPQVFDKDNIDQFDF
jgi:rhamnose transport system substrate-binding protein